MFKNIYINKTNKKSNTRKSLFNRFFISYILILLMPLIIGGYVYRQSIILLENETLRSNSIILEQTKNTLDNQLRDVDNMSVQLTEKLKMTDLLYMRGPIDKSEIYNINNFWKELSVFKLTNSFISDFFIYFRNSEMIISPDDTFRLSFFYDNIFKYDNMNYKDWYSNVLNGFHYMKTLPVKDVTVYNRTKPMLMYLHSITPGVSKDVLGNIVVLIDREEIIKLLGGIDTGKSGYICILDSDGNILTSVSGGGKDITPIDIPQLLSDKRLKHINKDGDLLISYTTSKYTGWTFIVAQPTSVVLEKVNFIKITTFVVFAICLIVGILTAFLLTQHNTKPIEKVVGALKKHMGEVQGEYKNEYEYLNSTISRLIQQDAELQSSVKKHVPILQADFIRRLISGIFSSREDVSTTASQLGFSLSGIKFCIVVAHIKGYNGLLSQEILEELNYARIIMRNTLGDIYNKAYFIDIDEDKLGMVLGFESSDDAQCKMYAENLAANAKAILSQQYSLNVLFYGGKLYTSLSHMFYSYRESREALEYVGTEEACKIIWYNQSVTKSENYYYPLDLELRLLNLVKAGNESESLSLIDMIYEENFNVRTLSADKTKYLFIELKATIMKAVEEISLKDTDLEESIKQKLKDLDIYTTSNDIYSSLKAIYSFICTIVCERKQSSNVELKQKITAYIHTHYMENDISLCKVATHFNLSEKYVSSFFKQQTRENFSEYIEGLRLRKACDLLKLGSMNIEDIACTTGYNSAHAFRRAFKKRLGVTPSDYK